MTSDDASGSQRPPAEPLAELLAADLEAIDLELAEIELLAGQVKSEAVRHEQRRAAAADKLAALATNPALADAVASYKQLLTLTRRAVLMDAQSDLLEAKGKALARHRAALVSLGEAAGAASASTSPDPVAAVAAGDGGGDQALSPSASRMVLSAQEDLRREIARSMHDGPAQSLTNIVLQAQIVERLMDRDPARARDELQRLAAMVQQTLDTTKSFIFDVRPMVLDDLGLMPTLRRSARERGRRTHIAVEFESHGQDRRLPMEIESALFRMLDEALVGYLGQAPERASLSLEWGATELRAGVVARRTPQYPPDADLPPVPEGDVPDAIRQMIQDRRDAHAAAVEAAELAARLRLPAAVGREVAGRAAAIGAELEVLDEGEVRIRLPLSAADGAAEP